MAFARICVLAFLLLFPVAPVQAQNINDEGAAQLKDLFDNLIAYQKNIYGLGGGSSLIYEGGVTVEPAGTYYAVTLPHMKILYEGGNQLEIGMISINASPHSKDGQWKMAVALPTPMTLRNKDKTELARLDIGGQRAAGIWHEKLEHFIKLDAGYENISIQSVQPEFSVEIPAARIRYDFDEDENGKWSGPGFFQVNNLDVSAANGARSRIGQVLVNFALKEYNPAATQNYRESLIALALSTKDAENQPMSAAHARGLSNMIFDLVTGMSNGLSFSYEVRDVHLSRPAIAGDGENDLKIASGSFGLDIDGLSADKVGFTAHFTFDGASMTPLPPAFADIAPTDAHLSIKVENLPFDRLSNVGKNIMGNQISAAGNAPPPGRSFIVKATALLSEAGTMITIDNNHIGNKEYKVELDGNARIDATAANSLTTKTRIAVSGLDKILAQTQIMAADGDHEHVTKIRQLNAMLGFIKLAGKIETSENDEFIHVYELEMTQDGKIMLNGQDFSMLTQLNGASEPEETATDVSAE